LGALLRYPPHWRVRAAATVALLALVASGCGTSPSELRAGETLPEGDVTVPDVHLADVVSAFKELRGAGLRVTIPDTFAVASLSIPRVSDQSPEPGVRVPAGSVVTLTLRVGLKGSPVAREKEFVIPDFVGQGLPEAVQWIEQRGLFLEVPDLGPLEAADGSSLFSAYVVAGQTPPAGTAMRNGALSGGAFRPTPIVLRVAEAGG
jgi:beta-lactam-binding protein with PASTA domain